MSSDKKLTEAERNRPEKPGHSYLRYRAQKLKEYGDDEPNKNKRFNAWWAKDIFHLELLNSRS
jgi:hypothetical protein